MMASNVRIRKVTWPPNPEIMFCCGWEGSAKKWAMISTIKKKTLFRRMVAIKLLPSYEKFTPHQRISTRNWGHVRPHSCWRTLLSRCRSSDLHVCFPWECSCGNWCCRSWFFRQWFLEEGARRRRSRNSGCKQHGGSAIADATLLNNTHANKFKHAHLYTHPAAPLVKRLECCSKVSQITLESRII